MSLSYDWMAGLAFFATLVAITMTGRYVAFNFFPELAAAREANFAADKPKMERKAYREMVKRNSKIGGRHALGFYLLVQPFFLDLQAVVWWRYIADAVMILMIYDFTYYLVHRFLFHGKLLRKIHAVHHQARTPTYIDSMYVHPVETMIGQGLFQFGVVATALFWGGSINAFPVVAATLVFMQCGTLNHVHTNLPHFPFRLLNFVTTAHAAHHVDMNQGNYYQISPLFDWMFGTFETPVPRETP